MLFPRYVLTDTRCRVEGRSRENVPVFFDECGVIESVTDYMVDLMVRRRTVESTVRTYADQICGFLRYLRRLGMGWEDASDEVLRRWRDDLLDGNEFAGRRRLAPNTVAGYLNQIFSFYRWAEESGRVRNFVAIYPDRAATEAFRISARMGRTKGGRRITWYWTGLPRCPRQPNRHTPTSEEIERIHSAAYDYTMGDRDSLIMSFAEDGCLRRTELLGIAASDIPSWDSILDARAAGKTFTVEVCGKGGKRRYVSFSPQQMERAREYIEGLRQEAVAAARRRCPSYREPKALFLSKTSGMPLAKTTVSKRVKGFYNQTGVKGSLHRLRARGLTSTVAAYDGFDDEGRPFPAELVLIKGAEKAGHSHWESLRPYLALHRASKTLDGDLKAEGQVELNNLRKKLLKVKVELSDAELLKPVIEAYTAGRYLEAEKAMNHLIRARTAQQEGS